tara:strand:- start:490 stop:1347 length:858 start_codon:yes stop_codon:yes gene_type:complete
MNLAVVATQNRRCVPLLGTYVEFMVDCGDNDTQAKRYLNAMITRVRDIERSMSFHELDSELSHINRLMPHCAYTMSEDMTAVLNQVTEIHALSNGQFDCVRPVHALTSNGQLPDHGYYKEPDASWQDVVIDGSYLTVKRQVQLDLGGIAKGYAVDQAMRIVTNASSVIVNAGGDSCMHPWENSRVRLKYASNTGIGALTIPMEQCSVATSSTYYTNGTASIIGDSIPVDTPIQTVSVFADSCMIADALTKLAWLSRDNRTQFKSVFDDYGACVYGIETNGTLIHY